PDLGLRLVLGFGHTVMSVLLLRSLTGSAWWLTVPPVQVHSKPLQEQLRVLDITIRLTSRFMCCLPPAVWVLSYKKQE
uniref:cytochrome c oxidase subunit 8A, mitochondrial-like n=1 Tax=Arvicanthis niloticus TaxID=61156 RepID=UPI001485D2F4